MVYLSGIFSLFDMISLNIPAFPVEYTESYLFNDKNINMLISQPNAARDQATTSEKEKCSSH